MGFRPGSGPTRTLRKSAAEPLPGIFIHPHGRRVDRMLHQPMDSALRPDAHCMEHEVTDVGLLSLVHHVVMFVKVKNVSRRNAVGLPSLLSSSKCVMVSVDNCGHRTGCPLKNTLKLVAGVRHHIEVVEVDIKDGAHYL
jgi:hypothetical protein